MNLFELVLKQMRQRALSTWLTLLSVLLGVALAVAIMILRREGGNLFGQTEYGYDIIVGSAKGSPLQLVLNTVYHIDRSPGVIPYTLYENYGRSPLFRPMIKIAVPYAVGDSYKDHRIVGTTTRLFNADDEGKPVTYPDEDSYFCYRPQKRYEVGEGRFFASEKFEAVIGSDVPRETGLKLGETFQATHGLPRPGETPDIHKPKWTVVGVLKPTHTAADRVLFIPLVSFYTIAEHDVGLVGINAAQQGQDPNAAVKEFLKPTSQPAAQEEEKEHFTVDDQGRIHLDLPKSIWGVNAILIRTRGGASAMSLMYIINNGKDASAVNPASAMREFFSNFLKGPSLVLLLIALLVTIVAGVGILVSIYNSVSARLREIAILRALGATRARILALICFEAGLIGLIGGIAGLIAGHLLGGVGSAYAERLLGESMNWLRIGPEEWGYLGIVVVIAVLAGLVPALKAYRTPVATNLIAG